MNSEKAVFDKLSRTPIEEMIQLHRMWISNNAKNDGVYPRTLNIEFCRKNGWTWPEYVYARHVYRMNKSA